MSNQINITKAMREWVRRLANPKSCKLLRDGSFISSTGTSSYGAPTRDMVRKLEKAGLILWRATANRWADEEAYLTDYAQLLVAEWQAGKKATGNSGGFLSTEQIENITGKKAA